jgi:hypothetical protein
MPNGDVVFPSRGGVPTEVAGYVRDAAEPNVFHPAPGPCKYRAATFCELPCGKVRATWACAYFQKEVTLLVCQECTVGGK